MIDKRETRLLDEVQRRETCSYDELARRFGVSAMTIRRDVDKLADRGAVIKTLGGVRRVPEPSHVYESTFLSRLLERPAEKAAIARRALALIEGQETLFLDGGTTCLELARLIARGRRGHRIVTHSAMVCLELSRSSENTVIALGGQLDSHSMCFHGPSCEAAATECHADAVFISTKGLMPLDGTYESFEGTLRIKQIMVRQGGQVILLADHSKVGSRALRKVLDISQIHTVVTDDKTAKADLARLKRKGCTVHVAAAGSEGGG